MLDLAQVIEWMKKSLEDVRLPLKKNVFPKSMGNPAQVNARDQRLLESIAVSTLKCIGVKN